MIAQIASSTTPSAAPSAALPAMPSATAKRYRMSTEEMKAKVLEYIRRNTIDGVAPTAQGIGEHTNVMQRGDHTKGAAMNSNASFRTP